MSEDEVKSTMHLPPGVPGGVGWTLLHDLRTQTFSAASAKVLCILWTTPSRKPRDSLHQSATEGETWRSAIYGATIPYGPHAVLMVREGLEQAAKDGRAIRPIRPITLSRLKGANHFPQWDFPAATLEAFLTDALNHDIDVGNFQP